MDGEPLDLVIDDASHLYGPTMASFEVLFPRLRPGGLYVIEDWFPPTPMIDLFAQIGARPRSEEAVALEASLAGQLLDTTTNGGRYFTDWFVRAALDPASPHHEVVRGWYQALLTADQPAGRALRDRFQPLIEGGWAALEHHRTLTTMATELVIGLANRAVSGIAEVRITPAWIEIRRSDRPSHRPSSATTRSPMTTSASSDDLERLNPYGMVWGWRSRHQGEVSTPS